MKFYLFYLKPEGSLYAYTTVKEYAEKFLQERNSECFKLKKVKLEGEKEKIFIYTNKLLMLNSYPLQTGISSSDYIEMIMTAKEDDTIEVEVESIVSCIEKINNYFIKHPIKEKYDKSIKQLTHIYDNSGHITIDTLSLFIDLHKDTFIPKRNIKKNEISVWETQLNNLVLDNF